MRKTCKPVASKCVHKLEARITSHIYLKQMEVSKEQAVLTLFFTAALLKKQNKKKTLLPAG